MNYKLAFLGFGNVGRALAELLLHKQVELEEAYDITFMVTGISTGRHGSLINPNGVELAEVFESLQKKHPLDRLSSVAVTDTFDFIHKCGADVLFENSPVNYETGQPSVEHVRLALEQGMHVITANKGTIVHAYRELTELARSKGKYFLFESTVMDGAPIFSLFRSALPVARLQSFKGILNSTTNLILTRMETGESFDAAVKYAQEIGISETDPAGDIDGWDAAVKVAALATVLMNTPIKPSDVERAGIRHVTPDMIRDARMDGKRYKLICSAERDGEKIKSQVAPELVPASSPFFSVTGTSSAITFETDALSGLTLVESEPGPQTTAYGLLADFVNAVSNRV